MLVKFSTLAGGVFIEVTDNAEYQPSDRCFRFAEDGSVEYTTFRELETAPDFARWYGHQYRASDFTVA